MSHPLLERIREISRQVRRLWVLWGAGLTVLALLGTALGAVAFDWWFRWDDPLLRSLLTAAVVGLPAWTAWRYLRPAVREPLDDLRMATEIERVQPEFRDRLAGSVAFLQQAPDDPTAGSLALRSAVIRETAAAFEDFDRAALLRPRLALRTAGAAAAVLLFTLILVALSPATAAVGATRLFVPWGGPSWPKRHDLLLAALPTRAASDQPIELKLRDANGRLPREVRSYFRQVDGNRTERTELQRYVVVDPAELKVVFPAQRTSFEFRFAGGDDDDMPWHRVTVLPPPTLSGLKVAIVPPAYSGLPGRPSERFVQALQGSRIEVSGKASKPLARMFVQTAGKEIAGDIAPDRTGFTAAFTAEASGDYAVRIVDLDGFTGGDDTPAQLFVQPDEPPTLTVERPAVQEGVSPTALVPLKLTVRDDLTLKSVVLKRHRGTSSVGPSAVGPKSSTGPKSSAEANAADEITLFVHPTGTPQPPLEGEPPRPIGETRTVQQTLDLRTLEPPLRPGEKLTLWFAASDFRPNVAEAGPLTLTVLAPDDLLDRITARQGQVLAKLGQWLKRQQEVKARTGETEITLDQTNRWTTADLDRLQGAELQQREIKDGLDDGPQGVPSQLRRMLDDLRNNRLADDETSRRLEGLLGKLEALVKPSPDGKSPAPVPEIGRRLNEALKTLRSEPVTDAATPTPAVKAAAEQAKGDLAAATERQETVVRTLQEMLGELAEWNDARRFREELRGLAAAQDEVAKQTAKLGRSNRGSPEERQAENKKLVRRQQELAAETDRLMQRMQDAGEQWKKSDPTAAEPVADALDAGRERGVAAGMREAARELEQGRTGNAGDRQAQAQAGLQEMLETLAQRPESNAEKLVEKLRGAERELDALKKRQQETAEGLRKAQTEPDPQRKERELARLRAEQQETEREAARLARKLQRLQAEKAAAATEKAAAGMRQAGANPPAGDDGETGAAQAEQAAKDLDEASEKLAEERKQVEFDLAFEQLLKMEQRLTVLKERQERLAADVARLAELRKSTGSLTPAQRSSQADLGSVQEDLARETTGIAGDLAAAEVFKWALEGAVADMREAAGRLDETEPLSAEELASAATEAESAGKRLGRLLEALQLEPGEDAGGDDPGAGAGQQQGPQDQQPPADGIPSPAQLKLLRLLQEDINRRTHTLEEALRTRGEWTPAERRSAARLAEEQGTLRKLLVELAAQAAPPAENP